MSGTTSKVPRSAVAFAILVLTVTSVVWAASVGAAEGVPPKAVAATSIELQLTGCATDDGDPATGCHVYRLRDESGRRSGTVAKFREPVSDADGNVVGRQFAECIASDGAGEICTLIEVLRDGPYTDPGTLVLTGLSSGRLAVTGGTGAYAGASGDATLGSGLVLTIDLQP